MSTAAPAGILGFPRGPHLTYLFKDPMYLVGNRNGSTALGFNGSSVSRVLSLTRSPRSTLVRSHHLLIASVFLLAASPRLIQPTAHTFLNSARLIVTLMKGCFDNTWCTHSNRIKHADHESPSKSLWKEVSAKRQLIVNCLAKDLEMCGIFI